MQEALPHPHPARVHCARCDRALYTVTDTRFGLAPASALCPPCGALARHASGA